MTDPSPAWTPGKPELVDASLAEARQIGVLPPDMLPWMARTITAIDNLSKWVAYGIAWVMVPLIIGMVYEVVVRKLGRPTIWAYDISRMLYGAHFMLGAAYVLSRGLHIRSDFLYRDWSVKTQAKVDLIAYFVFFFPTLILFTWVSYEYALKSVVTGERSTETALMPMLGPIKSCIPVTGALLTLQGVSEVLKCFYALRHGRWPHQ